MIEQKIRDDLIDALIDLKFLQNLFADDLEDLIETSLKVIMRYVKDEE